jgi:hypothetical protein
MTFGYNSIDIIHFVRKSGILVTKLDFEVECGDYSTGALNILWILEANGFQYGGRFTTE